ncbi:hypothetical protein QWZ04_19200 [Vibrio tapetis subsp. quintayensis]|uniref:hypothetical protein n=1 Tax=Vibrio tapetis TaxID=52443 RepID=UPI0025B2B181|nr:hypothetical protein [Vibrio tapetis]MDN3682435.1 hypothetical protein [Vibrio tapetis subsp. quintayensis]
MKKTVLLSVCLLMSFGASADVTIEKNRVVCQSESAIKLYLKRKNASNKNIDLPSDCRKIKNKRSGEVKSRGNGYVEIEPKFGDSIYVDKDAIR